MIDEIVILIKNKIINTEIAPKGNIYVESRFNNQLFLCINEILKAKLVCEGKLKWI